MPPLSWQNPLEDVGYVSDDRSPLYRSPCMEPWTKQMMPKTKEEANRFWNPIPFPKWQFHLNTSSPINGLTGKPGMSGSQLPSFAANAAATQIKPSGSGGVIFIDDSPVGSCSVISISSSSEEEENELGDDAADVKDVSMLSFQNNTLSSFTAQTPSPLNKESKEFASSLPQQQQHQQQHQHQQSQHMEMTSRSGSATGDTSHLLTSSRPKRSRIVPLIPQDAAPPQEPPFEHNYIFSAPVPPSSGMNTGNAPGSLPSESCIMRREHHSSPFSSNTQHSLPPSNRLPAHNCHYTASGNSVLSSNRRYYEHDTSHSSMRYFEQTSLRRGAAINGSCCADPFAPPLAADQAASRCGRCCNPPVIERPRHVRSSQYIPFPTQDFLPPSATIVHVPQTQLPSAPQIQPHNGGPSGACGGTPTYTSFTYFSK